MLSITCLHQISVVVHGRGSAGLDMLRDPIHGSGNPVPWDVEHGAEHRELLAMLHVKRGDYAHWAVRMDRATRRVDAPVRWARAQGARLPQ